MMRLVSILMIVTLLNANAQNKNTEVLVLGTPHLSTIKGLEPTMLKSTLEYLNSFNFDAVCVENMDGQLLNDLQSRNDLSYDEVWKQFSGKEMQLADSARKILNITRVEAEQEQWEVLRKSNEVSAENMLRLVEVALAAGNYNSAVLASTYITEEQRQNSSLSGFFYNQFEASKGSINEIFSIGLSIAKARGLKQLAGIDNVQDEAMLFKYFDTFIADYTANQEQIAEVFEKPIFKEVEQHTKKAIQDKDLLNLYTFYNGHEFMDQDYEAQWKLWLETGFDSKTDLSRYYLWEMRNVQIVANVIREIAFNPGKKILIIIGASHKSFLEKYLKAVPDITLLDFNASNK